MRKTLLTLTWLVVALTVPVGAGLDAVCRLQHMFVFSPPDVVEHTPHARHHDDQTRHGSTGEHAARAGHHALAQNDGARTHTDHGLPPAPVQPDPASHEPGQTGLPCCPMVGPIAAAFPGDWLIVAASHGVADLLHWTASAPMTGHEPSPALGPPRA